MTLLRFKAWMLIAVMVVPTARASDPWTTVRVPEIGEYRMTALTAEILEVGLITTRAQDGKLEEWNFVNAGSELDLPETDELSVVSDGRDKPLRIGRIGFKRRVAYAPVDVWDLRIGNYFYIELQDRLLVGETVRLEDKSGRINLGGSLSFEARYDPEKFSPVIHVNQAGYPIRGAKVAKAGFYMGSLGEMDLSSAKEFHVRDVRTREIVHRGKIERVSEDGFSKEHPYQRVLHLDFTSVKREGVYSVGIAGVGESYPFWISDGFWSCLTRTYALGTYHQRSGVDLEMPYSRFTHPASHTEPAFIPEMTPEFEKTQELIKNITEPDHPDQRAPEMTNVATALYPFVKKGRVDTRGGHHDAGDYSKYTINSAHFVNALLTAVDVFPGVAELDNLGLPESGDGIGDLLQIAKWEADFLSKLQDDDGGFFFLVYPKERAYEGNVPPDQADPQVVFPKNTAATAAAGAALAQIGSSSSFRKAHPVEAKRFVDQAVKAWEFLQKARSEHGEVGAYQTVSHYGDIFMDRDELVWLATELYLATKQRGYHEYVLKNYDPQDENTRRWKWLRMHEGYGAAARSYAFAERSGRTKSTKELDVAHLRGCTREILARADELKQWSEDSTYGISFPPEAKKNERVGWHFPVSNTFDMVAMAVVGELDKYDTAVLGNVGYEMGANPCNVCLLTGLGWRRQFEIVHQWARNDDYALPMTGIPIGSLKAGLPWIPPYEGELGKFSYPLDGASTKPYGFYDRWEDTFNVETEFVNVQQARGLAVCAFYMAQTSKREQAWKFGEATIVGMPEFARTGDKVKLGLDVAGDDLDLDDAFLVWETRDRQPYAGLDFEFRPKRSGRQWVAAEAQWPDGRRVFAKASFSVGRRDGGRPAPADDQTVFLLNADAEDATGPVGDTIPESPKRGRVEVTGNPVYSGENLGWMIEPKGAAVSFDSFDDYLKIRFKMPYVAGRPPRNNVRIAGWFYFEKFAKAVATEDILSYGIMDTTPLAAMQFNKWAKPTVPHFKIRHQAVIDEKGMAARLDTGEWRYVKIDLRPGEWRFSIDNREVSKGPLPDNYTGDLSKEESRELIVGGFIGAVDELRVREF